MTVSSQDLVDILNEHRRSFLAAKLFADKSGHTVPCDTKSWSQILATYLSGIPGLNRKKGSDLEDGSDVKAANAWDAIDKPRFNGVLSAGRVGTDYGDISSLDSMPYLIFVLWDWVDGTVGKERCRAWAVRTKVDRVFRDVAQKWYELRGAGEIRSANFQLHPPIHRNEDVVTNECGNMQLPLLFMATWRDRSYVIDTFDINVLRNGSCKLTGAAPKRTRK